MPRNLSTNQSPKSDDALEESVATSSTRHSLRTETFNGHPQCASLLGPSWRDRSVPGILRGDDILGRANNISEGISYLWTVSTLFSLHIRYFFSLKLSVPVVCLRPRWWLDKGTQSVSLLLLSLAEHPTFQVPPPSHCILTSPLHHPYLSR